MENRNSNIIKQNPSEVRVDISIEEALDILSQECEVLFRKLEDRFIITEFFEEPVGDNELDLFIEG